MPAGSDSQWGFTLLSSTPVIVEDLRTETRLRPSTLMRDHGAVSGMSVIIHASGRPYGVLSAHTLERREFTGVDVDFLKSVANVLAAAIERRQLEETCFTPSNANSSVRSGSPRRALPSTRRHWGSQPV